MSCPHCHFESIAELSKHGKNKKFIFALRGIRMHQTRMHKQTWAKYPRIELL